MSRRRNAPKTPHADASRRDHAFDPTAPGGWGGGHNGSAVVAKFLSSLGSWETDPSAYVRFVRPRRLSPSELEALHVDAIGRRIAELPAYEATREGYKVRPQGAKDADLAQRVVDWLATRADDLQLLSRMFEARWRRRTYGSCLVVAGTEDCFERSPDDGRVVYSDFSRPLERGARVLWLRTFDARQYRIAETYGEGHPLCGQPRLYEVRGWDRPGLEADWALGSRVPSTAATRLVHASRVWRDAEPEGWSIFDGLARDLASMRASAKGAESALNAMAVPVYEINHLRDKLERDEPGVRAHVHAQNQAKSLTNALITDKGEESFTWQTISLGGVSDIVSSLGGILSAATGIPMTLLFGMSPGGFSGGESEERNWHNYVRSVQRELGHGVAFVLRLLLGEAGVAERDFAFAVEWNKLVVLNELEAAQIRDTGSQYWTRIIDAGIVKPAEVRTSALGGEGWKLDVTVDAQTEKKVQANLGATEAVAVLQMVQAYYAPDSTIPREAAIAYVISVDPSTAATAATLFQPRPVAVPTSTAVVSPAAQPALAASPTPVGALGAGPADPAADEPALEETARPEDAQGNTWLTAREVATKHAVTEAWLRKSARAGLISHRKGTGRSGAAQYAEEHVLEALQGSVVERAPAEAADLDGE